MASVRWPLLVVVLLTGVGQTLLFTNENSEEDPGYGVRHHIVRGHEADGTLTSRENYRYNAPPKDSAVEDENADEDSEGKNADKKEKSTTNKDKNTAEMKEVSDKEDKKGKSSAKKDKSTTKEEKAAKKDKSTKKDKGPAKDKKTAKKEKDSAEKDEDITTRDDITKESPPKNATKTFVLHDITNGKPMGKGGGRGGRNLPFDEDLFIDGSSDSSAGKLRVIELVITIMSNETTNETKSEPMINCVDNETYIETIASLQYLTHMVQQIQVDYNSFFVGMFAIDCSDIAHMINESRLQTFNLEYKGKRPVTVMCDMETDGGGWTVVQRRNGDMKHIDFNRGWYEYKVGFGDPTGEYWVGLDNLYAWTNMRQYQLRIELMDYEGNCKYAVYKQFYLDDETQGYRLHVTGYLGNAGDALTKKNVKDNFTADGMMFTTKDRDNDMASNVNCAQFWKTGGWWYNRCAWANLNGPSWMQADGTGVGINWHVWRNKEHLKSAIMMIRPVGRH